MDTFYLYQIQGKEEQLFASRKIRKFYQVPFLIYEESGASWNLFGDVINNIVNFYVYCMK